MWTFCFKNIGIPILRIWTCFLTFKILCTLSHLWVVWERKWGHCLSVILLNILIPAHIRRLNTWTGKGTAGYLFYREESDLWIALLGFQCYCCGVVLETTHGGTSVCDVPRGRKVSVPSCMRSPPQAGEPFFTSPLGSIVQPCVQKYRTD